MFKKLFGKNSNPSEQALEFTKQGVSAIEKGDIDTAIDFYNKAIDINPQLGIAYINRGYAFFSKGDLVEAIRDATKAIELDPESIDAYGVRGDAYFQNESLDKAITDYSKAIELNPQLAGAYRKRASVYHTKGKLLRAIEDYETYIRIAPNAPDRANIQAYIDYLNDHGAKDGDVDFSPRMPKVDEDRLTDEVISIAENMATDQAKRQLIIITPGRLIKTSNPLPPRETLKSEFLNMIEGIAPSSKQWNIVAIGMTEFRAFSASPNTSVPFLDLLHGFVQIGHAVILYEGHPSGFTQMCHNRDLLIIDGEMIPFLQSNWLEIAKSTMRQPNILKVNRKGRTVQNIENL